MKRLGISRARQLRLIPTDAETRFWGAVRNRQIAGAKFKRQAPIEGFIVDFVCLEARLVVEIDGGQHNENLGDEKRTVALNTAGYRVIRFWNNDVLGNLQGVLETLVVALTNAPSPRPSPQGERE